LVELPYQQLAEHFRREVKDFFVNSLGRPEILNRIGEDNILVFRFLVDEAAKLSIVEQQIDNLNRQLASHDVRVHATTAFRQMLMCHPSGFSRNGARGVRNLLTKWVINRLATDLFLDASQCEHRVLRADYRVPVETITTPSFVFDPAMLSYKWIEPKPS
jgi:ATP-dependent Clp protease ATP-binding subunit ClpA